MMPSTVRIMTYNLLNGGVESDGTDRITAIAEVIRQATPDVVAVQEANNEALFYTLARQIDLPQAVLGQSNRGFHLGLLSRFPVESWQMHNQRPVLFHGFLEVHLQTPAGKLAVFVAHLHPGYADEDDEFRLKEVEFILQRMQPYRAGMSLLTGDFNTVSPLDEIKLEDWPKQWQKWFHSKQGGEFRRETLGRVLTAGYQDSYRRFHPGSEPGYTLPASNPNVRLDYIFASPPLATHLTAAEVVRHEPASMASDHLPLLAQFDFD